MSTTKRNELKAKQIKLQIAARLQKTLEIKKSFNYIANDLNNSYKQAIS